MNYANLRRPGIISPKPINRSIRIDSQRHPSEYGLELARRLYRPQRKPVTIGIGFAYDGGLLLCADTKVSGAAIKDNQSKIDIRVSNNGYCKIAFAMSGVDLNFPKSALEKCWAHVQSKCDFAVDSLETVVQTVEESLAVFYQNHVFPHPDRQPNSLYLEFLVGIWLRDQARLYISHETLLQPVPQYECIGSAAYLANYLIRQYLKANPGRLDFADSELLATFAVGSAIEYDEACGGVAELLTIASDGTVKGPQPLPKESFQFVEGMATLMWKFHRNFFHLDNRWTGKELDSEYKTLADAIHDLHTSVWFNW